VAIAFDADLGATDSPAAGSVTLTTTAAAASVARVVVIISYFRSVNTGLSGVTIGGTAAALDKRAPNGSDYLEIWSAHIAAGLASSSSIVCNMNGSATRPAGSSVLAGRRAARARDHGPEGSSAVTTAEGAWNSLQYTLIPAYDPRPGKVYVIEAGGLITTAATGALTLAPSISTTNAAGTTLGTSIAQTVPASSLSGPWYLKLVLVVLTTGAPGGSNSTIKGTGFFQSGGVAATATRGLT
jgi:hypothetical protein